MKKSLIRKREVAGWLFILPWFIGLLLFFIQPMVTFFRYSFTNFVFTKSGYALNPLKDGLLGNYRQALMGDAQFPQLVFESFRDLLYQVPIIVFFSLFVAVILNRRFHGRLVMRTIFFLPIIITSSVIAQIIRQDTTSVATMPVSGSSNLFDVTTLTQFLLSSGLSSSVVNLLGTVMADVADLVWESGVQILIFLAALLAVPPSYYEVAQVEGASGWETFWKVTFPIVSPFVLANLIYTIVDRFTNYSNGIIQYILTYFMKDMNYSYAAALSWIYLVLIGIVLAVVFLICRRMVFYNNR